MLDSVKTITLDLETTGLDPWKDKILCCAYRFNGSGSVVVLDFTGVYDDTELRAVLARPEVTLRGHNVKFDVLFLIVAGYDVRCRLDDTKLLAYAVDPTVDLGLKDLAVSRCGLKVDRFIKTGGIKVKKKHRPYFERSPKYVESAGKFYLKARLLAYNADDVIFTDAVKQSLPASSWYRDVELPVTELLLATEARGAQLDIPYLAELDKEYEKKLEEKRTECLALLKAKGIQLTDAKGKAKEFNPNSPQQVAEVFRRLGYDLERYTTKTDTGEPSCDGLFLKKMSWRGETLAKPLLDYRQLSKLRSTYSSKLLTDCDKYGRIHGSFNQVGKDGGMVSDISGSDGTATGRLTSADPNLQNIPSRTKEGKRIRRAFIATPGYWMFDADLKQIQPRCIAYRSQSSKLLNAYKNNWDTHGMFAADIFDRLLEDYKAEALKASTELTNERFIGKTSWLAHVFGCTNKKLLFICEKFSENPLSLTLKEFEAAFDSLTPRQRATLIATNPSEQEAREVHAKWMFFKKVQDKFEEKNPEIFSWRRAHIERTKRLGYLTTYGGRTVKVTGLDAVDRFERFSAERKAVNYAIQGDEADIMKIILVRFYKEIVKPGLGHLIAVVHDEILGEIRNDLNQAKMMEHIRDIMCNTVKLPNVPMDTDAHWVSSWAEK